MEKLTLKVKTQKSSDKLWQDESGTTMPYSRITKVERKKETESAKLLKKALKINTDLEDFKQLVNTVCTDIYERYMESVNLDPTKPPKGNFTWFNFDRSIKIEVSISEQITFDDLGITACKEKLELFLNNNLESKDAFIKQMVLDAFETSRGKLDAKKVTSLLRYRSKIKAVLFQEALNLLEESIRRPKSKTYFKVSAKDQAGEYQNINLNFSSI